MWYMDIVVCWMLNCNRGLYSHCHMSRYGFDYGCIHVVMMSTEHDFRNTSKQYAFLADHLKSVNRAITPWLIFGGHR